MMDFSSCAQGISYCFLDIFSMCSQYTSQWVLNLILKRVLDIYLNVFTLHFLKVIHQSPFLRRFDPFLLQLEAFYSNQNLSHLLLCIQFPFVCLWLSKLALFCLFMTDLQFFAHQCLASISLPVSNTPHLLVVKIFLNAAIANYWMRMYANSQPCLGTYVCLR